MEEKDFVDKYWFSNTKIITVVNPRNEDYVFQATIPTGVDVATGREKVETRHYKVMAGGNERFPGPIANMFLDQMSKLVAQDEDKFQFMIDFALRAQYYDDLIVAIDDLLHDYEPKKEYLNGEVSSEKTEVEAQEEPFAAIKQEEKRKPGRPAKATTGA